MNTAQKYPRNWYTLVQVWDKAFACNANSKLKKTIVPHIPIIPLLPSLKAFIPPDPV